MNNISIIDNYNSFVSGYLGPFDINKSVKNKEYKSAIEDLKIIAGKSLVQLKEENPSLLVFPEDLGALQDGFNDKEKVICSLYPPTTCQFLETGNVMGWIGCGDTQLKIFSRFDSTLYEIIDKIRNVPKWDNAVNFACFNCTARHSKYY